MSGADTRQDRDVHVTLGTAARAGEIRRAREARIFHTAFDPHERVIVSSADLRGREESFVGVGRGHGGGTPQVELPYRFTDALAVVLCRRERVISGSMRDI